MKRILATTALAATLATGAMAATEAERQTVERFLPNVNVSTLTDTTVDQLTNIAYGGGSFSERQGQMEAIVNDTTPLTATFTAAQLERVQETVPDINIATMTDAQILQALNYINAADNPADAQEQIRAMLDGGDGFTLMLTDAEINQIRDVAPEFDVTTVTEEQAAELRAAVSTGDRDQIELVVESIEG